MLSIHVAKLAQAEEERIDGRVPGLGPTMSEVDEQEAGIPIR